MKIIFATCIATAFAAVALFTIGPGIDFSEVTDVADLNLKLSSLLQPGEDSEAIAVPNPIQPALMIGLATGDQQSADIQSVLESLGPGMAELPMTGLVDAVLANTDTTRRAGAIAYFKYSALTPSYLAFVPVNEVEPFVEMLGELAEVKHGDPPRIQWPAGHQMFFVHVNGFVYFSSDRECLEKLEGVDPMQWLERFPESSNVSLCLDATKIPKEFKNEALGELKKLIWKAAAGTKGFDDPASRSNLDQALTAQLILLKGIDQLIVNLDVVPESGKATLAWEVIGSPMSAFAKYGRKAIRMKPSRFTRFRLEDATVNMNFRSPILEEHSFELRMLAEILEVLEGLPDQRLDELANESGRAIKRTLEKGIIDGAVVGNIERNRFNLVSIFHVEDTRSIAKILDRLNRPSGSSVFGQKMVVNNMAGSYRGINFYQYMETMDKGPLAKQRMVLMFGAGQNEILLGIGADPMPLVRRCIDACDGELPLDTKDFEFQLRLSEVASFQATSGLERKIMEQLAESDRISMTSEFTKTGSRATVELDLDFLKSAWQVGQMIYRESHSRRVKY